MGGRCICYPDIVQREKDVKEVASNVHHRTSISWRGINHEVEPTYLADRGAAELDAFFTTSPEERLNLTSQIHVSPMKSLLLSLSSNSHLSALRLCSVDLQTASARLLGEELAKNGSLKLLSLNDNRRLGCEVRNFKENFLQGCK